MEQQARSTNCPTDQEFRAAMEASERDYADRLEALATAIPDETPSPARIRCHILGFLGNRYDARLRVYLKRTLSRPALSMLYIVETEIVEELQMGRAEDVRVQQPVRPLSTAGIVLTGVGAAIGGAAVAVTAGLAAPILLPSIAAAVGSGALAGGAGVAAVATIAGAAGAGWSGYKVRRHFEDISGIYLRPIPIPTSTGGLDSSGPRDGPDPAATGRLHPRHRMLNLNICVSGWYTDRADLPALWSSFMPPHSSVVLEYEADLMEGLGNLWENMAVSTVAGMAVGEALRTTVVGSALAAIAWPLALLQLGAMVDHPWWLAVGRSRKCGKVLARLLIARSIQGVRPVSLFGVSMGAIVVQHCLEELSRLCAFGIVEDVVLLGLPAKLPSAERLFRYRKVVAGRLVHGFSRNDWLLRFLFRTTRLHVGEVAGLVPWDVEGIESVDLTRLIFNHTEYRDKLEEIVELLNLLQ